MMLKNLESRIQHLNTNKERSYNEQSILDYAYKWNRIKKHGRTCQKSL